MHTPLTTPLTSSKIQKGWEPGPQGCGGTSAMPTWHMGRGMLWGTPGSLPPFFSIPPLSGCHLSSPPSPASVPAPCSAAGSSSRPWCSPHHRGPAAPRACSAWPGCPGRETKSHCWGELAGPICPILLILGVSQGHWGAQGAEGFASLYVGRNPEGSWELWDFWHKPGTGFPPQCWVGDERCLLLPVLSGPLEGLSSSGRMLW